MEFNEKLQELRKRKGLTQEELAEILFVSRTAISKWESGRGLPNIESLKAISKCFSVSLDELLSGEEILAIAEEDHKKKEMNVRDLAFGLFDSCMSLLLFLPFFAERVSDKINNTSLISLTEVRPYLKAIYLSFILVSVIFGILTLALQNVRFKLWTRNKELLSLLLSIAGVMLFIICRQPYPAVFTFTFLVIKVLLLIKRQ